MVNDDVLEIAAEEEAPLVRFDLGCGVRPKEGFVGVDSIDFGHEGQIVAELCKPIYAHVPHDLPYGADGAFVRQVTGYEPWPWEDDSVDEVHASHFVEHLDTGQRVHFFNELWRVLKPGAKATVVCPNWSSCRAYGDFTHKWPPVSGFMWFYLLRKWRLGDGTGDATAEGMANAPHTDFEYNPQGYSCDFDVQYGYSFSEDLSKRGQDYVMFALANYLDAANDIIATLTCLKPRYEVPVPK